jgi:hypothetical protein
MVVGIANPTDPAPNVEALLTMQGFRGASRDYSALLPCEAVHTASSLRVPISVQPLT